MSEEDANGVAPPLRPQRAPDPEDPTDPPRHLLDVDDLGRDEIVALLDWAEELRRNRPQPPLPLAGKVVGLFFFQPSTRTRVGFHAAAARLGATAVELDTTRYESGMSSPETPVDTFRSVASYCDLVVLRHRDEDELHQMAAHSPVPIINGGCGTSSHPTQTLVDLFYVRSHFGRIEGLRIGIAGNLAGSRAAKSLVRALRHFPPTELRLMAPEERRLGDGAPDGALQRTRLETTGLDVLYMAGFPPGPTEEDPSERKGFILRETAARHMEPTALILNPLPRIDEIDREVDRLPQAAYFDQSRAALFARMAVVQGFTS